jgi:hypothetical protein
MWVVWHGLKELEAELARKIALIDPTARMVLAKATSLIERKAKANFSGSHAKGQPHIGGDEPNVVTGYLRRSIITTTPTRIGVASYSATVGPTAIYGRAVELGLPRWTRGYGYPYFTPAVHDALPEIERLTVEAWSRVL